MGYIGKIPATQGKDAGPALKLDDISGDFDGLTTVFDLAVNGTAVDPHVNNISIYLSGVYQIPGNAYSLSGSQVVFTGAPSSSLDFHGAILGATRIIQPDNDSVEPASFTSNTRSAISGSYEGGGSTSISGSSTSTGSFGYLYVGGNVTASGVVRADSFEAVTGGESIDFGDSLNITGDITASGNISSSATIIAKDFSGTFIGALSSSAQEATSISGSFSKEHLAAKVANVVTSSAQLSTDISGSFSKEHLAAKVANVVTSSAQLATDISGSFSKEHLAAKVANVVTSSAQISADISGSFSKEHLAAKIANVVTSSAQLSTDISGSFGNQRVGTTDAVTFATVNTGQGANELYDMNQNVKTDSDVTFANATIAGTLSAQEIHTRFVSASVTLATGSNQFGDALTDVQNFTGSVNMSSSLSVFGHPTEKTLISGSSISASSAQFSTAQIDKFTGAIDFNNENMTNVDIDSGTITGITDLAVADGGTGVSTLTDGGVLLGSGTSGITAMSVLSDGEMIVGDGSTDPVAESGATLRTSIGVGTTDSVNFGAIISGSNKLYVGTPSSYVSASDGNFTVSGKAGIGTTAPTNILHIKGDSHYPLKVEGTNSKGAGINFVPDNGDDLSFVIDATGFRVYNDTVGAYLTTISGSGLVGIGTTAPLSQLHVEKNQNAYTRTTIKNTNASSAAQALTNYVSDKGEFNVGITGDGHSLDGAAIHWNTANSNMVFANNNSEVMRILAAGNVCIGGTTDEGYNTLLNLEGAGGTDDVPGILFKNTSASNDEDIMALIATQGTDSVGAINIKREGNADDAYIDFLTQANSGGMTERMRITSTGNVGIKTTSPQSLLEVGDATNDYGALQVNATGSNSIAVFQIMDTTTFTGTTLPANQIGSAMVTIRNHHTTDNNYAGIRFMDSGGFTNAVIMARNVDHDTSGGADLLFFTRKDNTNADTGSLKMIIDDTGKVGIGTDAPDSCVGGIHIYSGSSGATAHASADELILESPVNTGLSILAGTGAEASIYFGDSGDNDIGRIRYNHNNNSMDFRVNASTVLSLANNNRVTIEGADGNQLTINDGGSTNSVIQFQQNGSAKAMMGWDNTNPGTFKINGTTSAFADNAHFCITGSGLVGFGAESPGFVNGFDHRGGSTGGLIHLKGNLPRIIFDDDGDTPQWAIDAQDYFGVWNLADDSTTETRVFKIESSGNAIFTNTGTDLTVHADCSSGVSYFKADSGANTNAGMQIAENGTTRWTIANDGDASDNLILEASGSGGVAMTVLQNGYVGIGTNNPGNDVEIYDTGDSALILHTAHASDWAGVQFNRAGTMKWKIYIGGAHADNLTVADAGLDDGVKMSQGDNSWSSISSDERVKTNLVVIPDALNKVNTLRAVNFNWKYGSEERRTQDNVGLIAQDVYKVLPEACTVPEKELEIVDHPEYEGEKQAKNMWTYSDTKIVPLLVKAVQELSEQNKVLEKRIEELENE